MTAPSDAPRVALAPVATAEIEVTAADGVRLAATLFSPAREARRVVVIASATGVSRGLYTLYARFLAARGAGVVTFDFRGVGGSLREPAGRSDATILDWGRRDYPAILGFAARRFPDRPLHLVGHSIGGQLIGMLEPPGPLASVITVAAQNAWYRRYGWRRTVKYGLLWRVGVPAAVGLLGYFPAERLGLGADLPGGVARDWARFATHPAYLVDADGACLAEGFENLRVPLLAYSFRDDHRATGPNVEALHRRYRRATVTYRDVDPKDVGVASVGHMGFFSPTVKRTLWTESLRWLEETT